MTAVGTGAQATPFPLLLRHFQPPLVARVESPGTAPPAILRGRAGRRSFDSRTAAEHEPTGASSSRALPCRSSATP
jgi:hypothetical protein